jgi:hypothetical protein
MKTLSVIYERPIQARNAALARVRFRIWHMLLGALLVSLLGWGVLFLVVDLAAAALHRL